MIKKRFPFTVVFLLLISAGSAADAETSFQAALQAVAGGNHAEALDHFEAALREEPDDLRYGSEYRQAIITTKQYDRALAFFEQLVNDNPNAANAYLNYGFAYVDKIPDSGSITQVIDANNALNLFTKSLELRPTWIGYYTRGNSYLYWPRIFNRTPLGIADLGKALELQRKREMQPYHARTYVSLGDGHWKLGEVEKARQVWKEGAAIFPDNVELQQRLKLQDDALAELIGADYDPNRRVDTNLKDLWKEE